MARNIWVTSDSHFGHANIIKYCDRPFSNVREMDDALVENWNSVVKPDDIIYHTGDVYLPKGASSGYWDTFFKRLNGRKRLILGNHDNGKDQRLLKVFEKINMWRMFKEYGVLLTHVPVHKSSFTHKEGMINVHGHTHNNAEPDGDTKNYKCVCVELTDYTPVNIEELNNAK